MKKLFLKSFFFGLSIISFISSRAQNPEELLTNAIKEANVEKVTEIIKKFPSVLEAKKINNEEHNIPFETVIVALSPEFKANLPKNAIENLYKIAEIFLNNKVKVTNYAFVEAADAVPLALFKKMRSKITDINVTDMPPSQFYLGNTALYQAVNGHDKEAVKYLLSEGADANKGESPLMQIIVSLIKTKKSNDLEIARMLIQAGAKPINNEWIEKIIKDEDPHMRLEPQDRDAIKGYFKTYQKIEL